MEEFDFGNLLFYSVVLLLLLQLLVFQLRQQKSKTLTVKNIEVKTARCSVEYDPNDPDHNMLYLFDRRTKQFLTQAKSIRGAVENLIKEGYEAIIFHSDHCPPELMNTIKNLNIDEFVKVK